jgi:uncharacterized membrane protein
MKPENYTRHVETVHGMTSSKTKKTTIIALSVMLLSIIGGLWIYTNMFTVRSTPSTFIASKPGNPEQLTSTTIASTTSNSGQLSSSGSEEKVVRIGISDIGTSARWYTYDSSGVKIKYFLVKGNDGKIHLAADACDICYAAKRGYKQTGNFMTCNNCGNTFAVNGIGSENLSGGCWPSYIPMQIDGSYTVIKISDLNAKRYMFV